MTNFRGKTYVVTGAGNGIGKATALALAERGAAVGAFDLDEEASHSTVGAIVGNGGRAVAVHGDTRKQADVQRAVATVESEFGGIDGLAAIAGVMGVTPVDEVTDDDWFRIMETNVKGPFLFIQGILPHLRARGGGAIVLASSVMAQSSAAGAALYSASKGAINSLTASLGVELAPENIRINAVAPGIIRTPMLRNLVQSVAPDDVEGTLAEWGHVHPIGRLIEPHEVATLVRYLLSDEASATTGSVVLADGGLLARLPG